MARNISFGKQYVKREQHIEIGSGHLVTPSWAALNRATRIDKQWTFADLGRRSRTAACGRPLRGRPLDDPLRPVDPKPPGRSLLESVPASDELHLTPSSARYRR
jgi:hypothetical protein